MAEGIEEATHGLLQTGNKMRTRAPDDPSPVRDMTSVYDTGCWKRKKIGHKGSNNKVKGKGSKGSASGGNMFGAIQIEESTKGKPMEKASVCISQREGSMLLGKVSRHCQGN